MHIDRLQSAVVGRFAFAFGMFACSLLRGIITEEDRLLNACTTHTGEYIRFEVVINIQTENSCRDQDETDTVAWHR